MKEGFRRGFLSSIDLPLELKFGTAGLKLMPEINRIKDIAVLQMIHGALKKVDTIEELRSLYLPYVQDEKKGFETEVSQGSGGR